MTQAPAAWITVGEGAIPPPWRHPAFRWTLAGAGALVLGLGFGVSGFAWF